MRYYLFFTAILAFGFFSCTKETSESLSPSVASEARGGNSGVSLSNGLVAFYPFNGNANDESGNGNNGTINGPVLTSDRFGKPRKAYYFQNGQNIVVPHKDYLNLSSAFSISLWYYPTNDYIAQDLIMKGTDYQTNTWWVRHHSLLFNDPNVNFAYRSIYGVNYWVGGPTPASNSWNNVIGVIQGTTLKFYLNGTLTRVTQNVDFQNLSQNMYNLVIGTTQYQFAGKIDDIRIYNRVLTDKEISVLANK